jgi:D-tyrosyl-tRNA(Tyr) deacylase
VKTVERKTNFSDETVTRAQKLLEGDTEMLHEYAVDGLRCKHCGASRLATAYDAECPALLRCALDVAHAKASAVKPLRTCGVCGNRLVEIRGRYPRDLERTVCPTCCAERLDQINHISSRDYGVAMQATVAPQSLVDMARAAVSDKSGVRDYDRS